MGYFILLQQKLQSCAQTSR